MVPDTGVHDAQRLRELQALPLYRKIQITQTRIIEWYQHYEGRVYVSFSGGKDSTVLLHIARQIYPNIPAVFANTGLEYGSIQRFVRSWDNVEIVTPKMRFDEVISTYGYPLIGKEVAEAIRTARKIRSQTVNVEREREHEQAQRTLRKDEEDALQHNGTNCNYTTGDRRRFALSGVQRGDKLDGGRNGFIGYGRTGAALDKTVVSDSLYDKRRWLPLVYIPVAISEQCCDKSKKEPIHTYERGTKRHPILGNLAEESWLRRQSWVKLGCNGFNAKRPKSQPMSFWTEQDVLTYLVDYNVPLADIWGHHYRRR